VCARLRSARELGGRARVLVHTLPRVTPEPQRADKRGTMMEAVAAAAVLGGVNAFGDYITLAFELQARPAYAVIRACVIAYCIGGIVGIRAKQMMLGALCGLVIGLLVGVTYQLLAPSGAWTAAIVAAVLFWVAFALLDVLLRGDSTVPVSLARGILGAALCLLVFYTLTIGWPERPTREPNLIRLALVWSGAFFPGFLVLFFQKG
jgi:hypothetical protein